MNSGNAPNQFNEFANVQQQKSIEVYAQSLAQQQRMALNNHAISQGMNAGHQGSPMTQPTSLEGSDSIYAGNQPRSAINAGQAGPPQGNHALQDYQMQLMLLEQQNKKRLLMARQEQDGMPGPQGGPGGFSQAMSPQGSRAGPSPNPTDQQLKKNNTPRMGSTMLPGSPMPDGMMPGQRNSPAPNMSYDSNAPPQAFQQPYPGLPGQMPTTPMMRPNPSSHPNFNPQQMQNLTPQQMDMMRQSNNWRGPQGQPGMMPQQMGPMGNQLQQRGQGQMPPPPAPAGEPPRPQVPSPQQPTQAPPTPNQTNKAGPKSKKATKDNIKVKFRAEFPLFSIVDVDYRSPAIKRAGTQVQPRQPLGQKSRPLQLPRCIIRTSHRMDSNSNRLRLLHCPKPQRLRSSSSSSSNLHP
jgi:hypothetical protein